MSEIDWSWLEAYPWAVPWVASGALILAAWVANFATKQGLVRALQRALSLTSFGRERLTSDFKVIPRLANIVPALVVWYGVTAVPGLPEAIVTVVRNVCAAFVVLTLALALSGFLDFVNAGYQRRPGAASHPIKGYLQVVKIVVFFIAAILMIAALVDRSPVILLSGLGAMAAVLMLIFQDTILSLVASVQISSGDIIRIGDWVEMPQLNADGDVVDIALHTVKVQNWDKTITTIPTKKFISESFKNWRGMQESGGRRIKRAIYLDQNSVRFLTEDEKQQLRRFALLREYLDDKEREISEWNAKLVERGLAPVNARRVTNIGTFRAYIERYLRSHGGIHQSMTLMVRQLAPGAEGLPLEIYCFTNTTAWVIYEGIQSDIFDHLLAILPEFGLRVYQSPSGMDLRAVVGATDLARPLGSGRPAALLEAAEAGEERRRG